jgi:histidinol phosphatase-like PHP family hydrolase
MQFKANKKTQKMLQVYRLCHSALKTKFEDFQIEICVGVEMDVLDIHKLMVLTRLDEP